MKKYGIAAFFMLMPLAFPASAQRAEQIDLETTVIKGNTELPKYLYVVPWQDRKSNQKVEQKLVLHNLYGDLFDPVLPAYIPSERYKLLPLPQDKK
jgi:hypothetical protein